MKSIYVACTVALIILSAMPVSGQKWHSNYESAQAAAVKTEKNIFLFFDMRTGLGAAKMRQVLQSPQLLLLVVENFEPVLLDYENALNVRSKFGVHRDGMVLIVSPLGKVIWKSTDGLSSQDIISALHKGTRGISEPKLWVPAAHALRSALAGKRCAGGTPIGDSKDLRINSEELVDLGILDKDKLYIARIEGLVNVWGTKGYKNRLDPLFKINTVDNEAPAQMDMIRFMNPNISGLTAAYVAWGKQPSYNPEHVYEFVLLGEGKPLRVFFCDGDYRDNEGAFKVGLYEAVPAGAAR